MSSIKKLPIDDELLAAYLDGRLKGEQEEYVENAIENSPELQWTVDRWMEMQMLNDKKEEPAYVDEERGVAATRKMFTSRIFYIAASILLLIGISIPLFVSSGKINPDSGMPYDFPAGERVPMEYSKLPVNPFHDEAKQLIDEDDKFSYRTVMYKSALIIMWEQKLEKVEYVLYSSSGTKLQWGCVQNAHTESIGLSAIDESYKPLWLALKFSNPDFYYADSIMVNY